MMHEQQEEPTPAGMLEWGREKGRFAIRKSLHSYSKDVTFEQTPEGYQKARHILEFMELLGMGQSEISKELRNWMSDNLSGGW